MQQAPSVTSEHVLKMSLKAEALSDIAQELQKSASKSKSSSGNSEKTPLGSNKYQFGSSSKQVLTNSINFGNISKCS